MSQNSIASVLSLYSIALDSHSWDLFDEIFAPDVEVDYPAGLHWHGLPAFKQDFAAMHETTAGHQHLLGPPHIIINDDRAFALTYGHFIVLRTSVDAGRFSMTEGGAWYDDELVCRSVGWRVRKRVARNFWSRRTESDAAEMTRFTDSFPDWVRSGRVSYMNARSMGR
jgi:hypothetical protein